MSEAAVSGSAGVHYGSTTTMRRSRRSRYLVPCLVATLFLAACDGRVDELGPLPEVNEWTPASASENATVLYLVVDFVVGDGFNPEYVTLSVDGVELISGTGRHRPEEHCNWYGPYPVSLDPGEHQLTATTGNGLDISSDFSLVSDSMGLLRYVDPSYGGYDDNPDPHLLWDYIPDEGFLGCA